ncbi:MAG TPA: VOC family protein [Xanthobacteraceae bacterium]|nr:VOC family protein [Xanthobacteraceae bacterium]
MIDHVSLIVGDVTRAEKFYDAIMRALGYPKVVRDSERIGYGERSSADHPERCYISIRGGLPKRSESRRHWAFRAPSRAAVIAFHRDGLANGGTDDGAPGLRDYHEHYFAAFLIDPDGNRLEAVCHRAED